MEDFWKEANPAFYGKMTAIPAVKHCDNVVMIYEERISIYPIMAQIKLNQ